MRVLTVIGARPQFIKAAAVSRALLRHRPDVREILVHTGQHYDANMSKVFFDELDIPRPEHNLGIGGGTHGQNTGRMMEKLEQLVMLERPDWVLVYGDTDSTLAGALVAAKLHVPVAHVEAGLRSYNRRMPEEINRVVTDHLSDRLFAPTVGARDNLLREGVAATHIEVVGDVMYDTTLFYKARARAPAWAVDSTLATDGFALCTIHRAENTDRRDNLEGILGGIAAAPLPVVLPIHPRTRKKMEEAGFRWPSNVLAVDPVGYLEMVWLEMHCRFVLTDSGGVQKEAYFHQKPCITLREETEWTELVDSGWNRLAGSNTERIARCIAATVKPRHAPMLYGSGDAAQRVAEALR